MMAIGYQEVNRQLGHVKLDFKSIKQLIICLFIYTRMTELGNLRPVGVHLHLLFVSLNFPNIVCQYKLNDPLVLGKFFPIPNNQFEN